MLTSSWTRVWERRNRAERCDALHKEKNIPSGRLQAEAEKGALNSDTRKKLNFRGKLGNGEKDGSIKEQKAEQGSISW